LQHSEVGFFDVDVTDVTDGYVVGVDFGYRNGGRCYVKGDGVYYDCGYYFEVVKVCSGRTGYGDYDFIGAVVNGVSRLDA